ncbi:MAG TPA: Trm112 family protein [Candidatus Dormibacteraeota bacterium]
MSSLPADLLAILACPQCRGPVQAEPSALRCDTCHLRYRVENDIPVMLISEADSFDPEPSPGA